MSCCDSLSEEINGLKIEISRLVNREFDLECEVKRLREGIEKALIFSRDNNERRDTLKELIWND